MPTSSDPQPAVRCTSLGKAYQLGEELTLRASLNRLVPGRGVETEKLWALNDVTFEVPAGAFFGIVGSNGSGKSTLTQIISGITVPTTGTAEVRGRILPLLEVGAGFHEELTGRENIALLGTILGLTRKSISEFVPKIQAFASVDRHLDTPLKRYSSGMQARLSFATAICFPSDVYVFDEVLAVVDDDFRDRCMAELAELNRLGRTIIFMSHDLDLVIDMCSTGMWLEKGVVRTTGSMNEVGGAYVNNRDVPVAATG